MPAYAQSFLAPEQCGWKRAVPRAPRHLPEFSSALATEAEECGRRTCVCRGTRRYARWAKGDVFVITGPVFTSDSESIGHNQVKVPTCLFKLVYDIETNRAWAHWQEFTLRPLDDLEASLSAMGLRIIRPANTLRRQFSRVGLGLRLRGFPECGVGFSSRGRGP